MFAAIAWRRFEAVCKALFGQAGFETRSQTHGADGGVDLWLHSRHEVGPVAVVQRKHCRSFYANEVLALGACSQPACHHRQPQPPPCRTRL